MKKDYLLFGKKLLIFLVVIGVLDVAGGKLFQRFYLKGTSGESAQTTYALTKATEDCVVFGSSRAVHHYIPSLFTDSLKLSCYNAGKDGQGILYQYAVLNSILSRKAPRAIVLDVDADEFTDNEVSYGRLSALLPYYYVQKEVQPIVNERGYYERIKVLSSLYRFNSLLLNTLVSTVKQDSDGFENGYKPLNKWWNRPLEKAAKKRVENIDTIKVGYFKKFLQSAQAKNIAVFVVVSPVFEKETVKASSLQMVQNICEEMKLPFLNVRQDPRFISHPDYFADIDHLNEKGALAYTRYICNEISRNHLINSNK